MKINKSICALLLGITITSCTSSPFLESNQAVGTASGVAAGALLGQLIGKDTKGTLIGAGVGALLGMGWGTYRDYQEQELKERLRNSDVKVNQVGNNLNLYLPSGITFKLNSASIQSGFYKPLNQISIVLKKYNQSQIIVNGYTDNTGPANYNLKLSKRRAESVKAYLLAQGIQPSRVIARGYGENNPRATNSTAQGRSENRRVEIEIVPLSNHNY